MHVVNGEWEVTTEAELTVRCILEDAGFFPATDYTLRSESPKEDYGSDYDRIVKIRPNQRFIAKYTGPTYG